MTPETIARTAHQGQSDQLGQPYIEHPRRVARRMDTEDEKAVAWLHDVLEDSDLTPEDLVQAGVPADIVDDVVRLTRIRGRSDAAYYAEIRAHPRALKVKLGDIADNTDPRRLLQLPAQTMVRLMAKYARALDDLTA